MNKVRRIWRRINKAIRSHDDYMECLWDGRKWWTKPTKTQTPTNP